MAQVWVSPSRQTWEDPEGLRRLSSHEANKLQPGCWAWSPKCPRCPRQDDQKPNALSSESLASRIAARVVLGLSRPGSLAGLRPGEELSSEDSCAAQLGPVLGARDSSQGQGSRWPALMIVQL